MVELGYAGVAIVTLIVVTAAFLKDPKIVVYGTDSCMACVATKRMLDNYGYKYEYKDITKSKYRGEFHRLKHRSIPQVYIDGKHIGGYYELKEWLKGK